MGTTAKQRLIFLLLAGASLTMTRCDGSTRISLPLEFDPSSLQCDDQNLLLFGARGVGSHKDLPDVWKAIRSEAVALRVRRGGSVKPRQKSAASDFQIDAPWRTSNFEASMFLSDSSWPRPGTTVYAILTSVSREQDRNGELMRSWDLAASWTKVVGAPQGLIGVSFYSESAGYVWSSSTIYHTKDGGMTWMSVESPGPLFASFRGLLKPSLDPTGALWTPIDHEGRIWRKTNLLARFSAAARPLEQFPNSPFRIDAIDASQAQTVWLLGQHRDRSRLELRRIDRGESNPRLAPVADFDIGLVTYLAVSRNDVAVGISYSKKSGPVGALLRSRDAGNNWKSVRLPEYRIHSYCMTKAGAIWMIGSSRHVYFEK